MPALRKSIRRSLIALGGNISRPRKDVFGEAAYVAYNFKWSKSEIMEMTQHERNEWIGEIRKLIQRERKEQARNIEEDMKRIMDNTKNNAAGSR